MDERHKHHYMEQPDDRKWNRPDHRLPPAGDLREGHWEYWQAVQDSNEPILLWRRTGSTLLYDTAHHSRKVVARPGNRVRPGRTKDQDRYILWKLKSSERIRRSNHGVVKWGRATLECFDPLFWTLTVCHCTPDIFPVYIPLKTSKDSRPVLL